MKRMIVGLCAISLAVGVVAFTAKPQSNLNTKKIRIAHPELLPCDQGDLKWFCIDLSCSEQDESTEWADVLTPSNYHECDANERENNCTGSTCVCAILACPDPFNSDIPVINQMSDQELYDELNDFAQDGDFDTAPGRVEIKN